MKSILMSIKPYYGFLIIAKAKGWDLAKYGLHEKTVEVRKGVPTSSDWDKKAALSFSKDKKSLARIPEEYRGEVAKLCGKVVGEFVCDEIDEFQEWELSPCKKYYDFEKNRLDLFLSQSCLSYGELCFYRQNLPYYKPIYGLHISDLKIYDKPKELKEFRKPCKKEECFGCAYYKEDTLRLTAWCFKPFITRPPRSWCYVEEL